MSAEPENIKQEDDLAKIDLDSLKDYLIDNLSVEQLNELLIDIEDEKKMRSMKEKRYAKFKKDVLKKKALMKKQIKEEEDELRLAMKKKLKKDEDEDDDLPKLKKRVK